MHAILVSMGTDGDVTPYIGLGTTLHARGHRVTLVANEHYEGLAAELGLNFRTLITDEEWQHAVTNPDMWHPVKGPFVMVRLGVRLIARQYEVIAELARDDDAVLVASPGVLAARVVRERFGKPLATVILQPWMIKSVFAPPVMPGHLGLPRWTPRSLGQIYWRLVDATGDLLVGRHLNRVRRSLGLKPVRRLFEWWLSPDLVIGMFPDWYGPPQPDWPPQLRLAGFPLYDGGRGNGLSTEVLQFCQAGEPPIVFTLGTGMMHAAEFFRAAADACCTLGARGLLLTRYGHQLPSPLPPFVQHLEFAPFLQLLPHCSALVHHGGAGTVAKALATGTPQLILPLAWDQPDNAIRVKRLGVGDWLKPSQRSSAHLARALTQLTKPDVRARCRAITARFGTEDALDLAARWVEELADHTSDETRYDKVRHPPKTTASSR